MQSQLTFEIVMMDVVAIKGAPFQPPSRTATRALKKLQAEIARAGVLVPLAMGSDGILADGHRRLACAKTLGIKAVPVAKYDIPSAELFATLNPGILPPSGKHWAEAVMHGLAIEEVRGEHQRLIRLWRDALGPEDFGDMATRRSPEIVKVASSATRLLGDKSLDCYRAVLLWLDKHSMQRPLIDAIRDGLERESLHAAITEDRPLRMQRVWS